MNKIEQALELSSQNYNCAQAVFTTYAESFGISEDMAKQIASGFGGGIGKTENICGAISGAVMLLGLKYYKEFSSVEAKEKIYQITSEFIEKFEDIHKSDNCAVLLGLKEKNNFECSEYIKTACEIFERDYL